MTAGDSMLPADARLGSPFAERPPSRWDRVDAWLGTASEYLNPILVKETRQALKSKQFLITFTLTLILGWGWSILGTIVAFERYHWGIIYAPHGAFMLAGYYWVLSFPLLIIVPFTAFRSLSVEREDGTYELVAISTLRPRQIVAGKLGSAVLQILLYLSALTPCMAFTYMLRGVDLFMILMVIGHLTIVSVFLSVIGLCFATVTTVRSWQMVLGVIFIMILMLIFVIGLSFATWLIQEVPAYQEPAFWPVQFLIATILIGYGGLFFLGAMARVTFDSDNKSTKLRVGMIALQMAAISWGVWQWLTFGGEGGLIALVAWSAAHWWLMGSLMVGESPDVSPRVRRQLPATFLGRSFFSWLYPGPGSGLMMASVSMFAVLLLVTALSIAPSVQNGELFSSLSEGISSFLTSLPLGWRVVLYSVLGLGVLLTCVALYFKSNEQHTWFVLGLVAACFVGVFATIMLIALPVPVTDSVTPDLVVVTVCMVCYVIIYVGLTRLIMLAAQNMVRGGIFLSMLLGIVLLKAGILIPFAAAMMYQATDPNMSRPPEFLMFLMLPCPPATFAIYEGSVTFTDLPIGNANVPLEPFILVVSATGMLVLNMLLTAREVDRQREAVPDRVLEEEKARRPTQAKPAPSSPWDVEEPEPPLPLGEGQGEGSED